MELVGYSKSELEARRRALKLQEQGYSVRVTQANKDSAKKRFWRIHAELERQTHTFQNQEYHND